MRFERSLQVFGYKYTFADLSASGKVAAEFPFSDKVKALKTLVSEIDTDYILVLDRLVYHIQFFPNTLSFSAIPPCCSTHPTTF